MPQKIVAVKGNPWKGDRLPASGDRHRWWLHALGIDADADQAGGPGKESDWQLGFQPACADQHPPEHPLLDQYPKTLSDPSRQIAPSLALSGLLAYPLV